MTTNNDYTKISSGFLEDCQNLLELYKKNDNSSYGSFALAWKQMSFSLVFLFRKTYAEILEFSEATLHIAKQFVVDSKNLVDKIFGLYLLYGLYYKIPIHGVKIRVTLEEWQIFLKFREQILEDNIIDACYIFVKLISDNAFYHCLFPAEYGLEKNLKSNQDTHENTYSMLQYINEDLDCGDLAEVTKLSKIYREKKAKLLGKSSKDTLKLYKADFLDEMMDELKEFQKKQEINQETKKIPNEFIFCDVGEKNKSNNKIRPKVGHGFDTDSSEDEDEDDTIVKINKKYVSMKNETQEDSIPRLTDSENDDSDKNFEMVYCNSKVENSDHDEDIDDDL